MRARASIIVDRPPAEVFDFVADFASHPKWRSEVLSSKVMGDPGVGMRVFQRIKLQGRHSLIEARVSEWEPPEKISFRYDGPPRVRGGFLLRPESGGAKTQLTVFATVALERGADLVEERIQGVLEGEARRDLARLKAWIERGEGPG